MIDTTNASAPPLIIVGGSTRSAAFSAVRAGFHPICFDLHADLDARQVASCHRLAEYPESIPQVLADLPRTPVIYVGGLENSPEILDAIQQHHELWGNGGEALTNSRDFTVVQEVLRMSRAPIAEWRFAADTPPRDGNWMRRPLAGTGGRGIHIWDEGEQSTLKLTEPHGFQQRIEGIPHSALFIADNEVGDVQFVGVTRQLIGIEPLGAQPHQWCGNIGPVTLPVEVEHLVRRVGNVLKWKCGMRGMYGVDFILGTDNRPWVTEVNPRYPASAELLEWATENPLLQAHARCFGYQPEAPAAWRGMPVGDFCGKAIVYATGDCTVSPAAREFAKASNPWQFPAIADIPAPGTQLKSGDPICTVFATSANAVNCTTTLLDRALEIREQLAQPVG
ncbi:MAG: ATP-grasp domain-containing protein [Planctomycetaceae bacterium]|nr:ATP-grasp domain-containing protein [Planctomycetaceae bacterium]